MLPPLPNLRKTTEKRTRWWTQMAGLGLWSLLQPLCMSLNIRSIKEEHDDVYTTPFLVALWHNRTVVPGYAWHLAHKPLNMCVLTSASKMVLWWRPFANTSAWKPSEVPPGAGAL